MQVPLLASASCSLSVAICGDDGRVGGKRPSYLGQQSRDAQQTLSIVLELPFQEGSAIALDWDSVNERVAVAVAGQGAADQVAFLPLCLADGQETTAACMKEQGWAAPQGVGIGDLSVRCPAGTGLTYAAVACTDGGLRLIDASPSAGSVSVVQTVFCHGVPSTAVSLSIDGGMVASGSSSGHVVLHPWSGGLGPSPLPSLSCGDDHEDAITGLCYSTLRTGTLAACDTGGSLQVWDAGSQRHLCKFPCAHTSAALALCFSDQNKDLLISGGDDGKLLFSDVSSGSAIRDVSIGVEVTSLSYHCDGYLLAAGTLDGQVLIFDLRTLVSKSKTAEPVMRSAAHADSIGSNSPMPLRALGFAPGGTGSALVSATANRRIQSQLPVGSAAGSGGSRRPPVHGLPAGPTASTVTGGPLVPPSIPSSRGASVATSAADDGSPSVASLAARIMSRLGNSKSGEGNSESGPPARRLSKALAGKVEAAAAASLTPNASGSGGAGTPTGACSATWPACANAGQNTNAQVGAAAANNGGAHACGPAGTPIAGTASGSSTGKPPAPWQANSNANASTVSSPRDQSTAVSATTSSVAAAPVTPCQSDRIRRQNLAANGMVDTAQGLRAGSIGGPLRFNMAAGTPDDGGGHRASMACSPWWANTPTAEAGADQLTSTACACSPVPLSVGAPPLPGSTGISGAALVAALGDALKPLLDGVREDVRKDVQESQCVLLEQSFVLNSELRKDVAELREEVQRLRGELHGI